MENMYADTDRALRVWLCFLTMPIAPLFQSSHKKRRRSDFVPYRDSVLTWLLKENLGMYS